MQNDLIMNLFR